MNTDKQLVYVHSDLAQLIPNFIKIREEDLINLEQAYIQKNFDIIISIAHKIKGSAGGYGFNHLGQLAAELEKIAKNRQYEAVEPILNDMRTSLHNSVVVYTTEAA